MTSRSVANEIVIHHFDTSGVDVVEVSEETLRWARRDCASGPERRRIRRPFIATIEKIPNLCGPVLRFASGAYRSRTSRSSRGASR